MEINNQFQLIARDNVYLDDINRVVHPRWAIHYLQDRTAWSHQFTSEMGRYRSQFNPSLKGFEALCDDIADGWVVMTTWFDKVPVGWGVLDQDGKVLEGMQLPLFLEMHLKQVVAEHRYDPFYRPVQESPEVEDEFTWAAPAPAPPVAAATPPAPVSAGHELTPLAAAICNAVQNQATPAEMLALLENGTTKAERHKARQSITRQAKASDPDRAGRFTGDMDAAEKAMLSDHVYTLDKPMDDLSKGQQKLASDFAGDSGWSLASDEQLKKLGIKSNMLTIKDTNFRAQVYMPDPEVFGPDAKPVLAFKGTESGSDWANNIKQGMNRESPYYQRAVELGKLIKDEGKSIEVTGHSLGGGMASATSKAGNFSATTYNPAGLHNKTVARYGVPEAEQGSDDNIIIFRVKDEILTSFQENTPAPNAIGNTIHTLDKPRSQTLPAIATGVALGLGLGPAAAIAGFAGVKAKEKIDLHGMATVREAIEKRKVDDLYHLSQQVTP